MNGEQFNFGQEIGEMKAMLRECNEGLKGLKEHINTLYTKDNVNENAIVEIKTKLSVLWWISGTATTALVGILLKFIFSGIGK